MLSASPVYRKTPRSDLHRQMIVLVGIGNLEAKRHNVEKRGACLGDAGRSEEIAGMEQDLVGAGRKPLARDRVLKRSGLRQRSFRDQPALGRKCKNFDAHAGGRDTAGRINNMDGNAWHGVYPRDGMDAASWHPPFAGVRAKFQWTSPACVSQATIAR